MDIELITLIALIAWYVMGFVVSLYFLYQDGKELTVSHFLLSILMGIFGLLTVMLIVFSLPSVINFIDRIGDIKIIKKK